MGDFSVITPPSGQQAHVHVLDKKAIYKVEGIRKMFALASYKHALFR